MKLAEALGISIPRLRLLAKVITRPLSLEAPRIDDNWNDVGLEEILVDASVSRQPGIEQWFSSPLQNCTPL